MRSYRYDRPEIEYFDGRAYPKVSPKRTHGTVQLAIGIVLARCGGTKGQVLTEVRFRIAPGTRLVPDVAFVSYDRLRSLTDREAEEPPFAPDIGVEVRSPSGRRSYEKRKIATYLQHGSLLVLDVDPSERHVVAHDCQGGMHVYGEGESFETATVPWLKFDVAEIFAGISIPR